MALPICVRCLDRTRLGEYLILRRSWRLPDRFGAEAGLHRPTQRLRRSLFPSSYLHSKADIKRRPENWNPTHT